MMRRPVDRIGRPTVCPVHVTDRSSTAGLSRPEQRLLASLLLGTSTTTSTPTWEQRRFSLKYAKHHATLPEMKPQEWIHNKRYGVYSYEKHIWTNTSNRVKPIERTHMNIWSTDTTMATNRFYTPYWKLNEKLHKLLGRTSSFESAAPDRRDSSSTWELTTDQRFKGVPTPAIVNLAFEDNWNTQLYERTHDDLPHIVGARKVSPKKDAESGAAATRAAVAEWWKRLAYLISVHRAAVGDLGPQQSRDIKKVHQFFTEFHDAMTGFEYQDAYLQLYLRETRPKELEDIFSIFLEMECNYVNEDYCPRCSLPTATTRFCGEGDRFTPFRQWRGRYAPHKPWGTEWYNVVAARAEQLWYRATEDPWFGTEFHTQAQAENLLTVYCKTKQRGKANDFLVRLRGSLEFLSGRIVITEQMQKMVDTLLDTTPHPHLPTEASRIEDGAIKYLGEANRHPFSPAQFRVDMELAKFRRMQREEGVIRLPPKEWSLDTSTNVLPPVKVHPTTRHVTNWRTVKAGLERSFLATGLQKGAYTSQELREIAYLEARIATVDEKREAFAEQLEADKKTLGPNAFVFPDADWYRAFNKSDDALRPFGVKHGQSVIATCHVFPDPSAVVATIGGNTYHFDTRHEATAVYGDYEYGQIVDLKPQDGATIRAVILGVNKDGPSEKWELKALNLADANDVLALGTDVNDIAKNWNDIVRVGFASSTVLDAARMEQRSIEEFEGSIIGVFGGRLYAQWDDHVAAPLGDAKHVQTYWRFAAPPTSASATAHKLVEPPSWNVPFRNDWSEERLAALKKAPWEREEWVSLIPNKYTPKPKQFGLYQHTTQDDFVTKEYKDRLTSKQFFTKPQAFAVIPDRHDTSVKFMGKSETLVTHGLPTVDRNELENGWDPVDPVPEWEVRAVEQALRDISGRRPGNFVKTPKEKSALQLNESWWRPLQYGWEQRNEEQMLLHPSARELTDPSKLPFGGVLPAHGTTHGIGERIRSVAEDYARGFDLGPHGLSPTAGNYDTLGFQSLRANVIGFGSVLVRLFNAKLGTTNEQQWASQFTTEDPKKLLIALNEWRVHGKSPAPMLVRVLQKYLKDEIAAYNAGVPDGVRKLNLDQLAPITSGTDGTANSVWADTDPFKYQQQYRRDFSDSLATASATGDQGYLQARFLAMNTAMIPSGDEVLLGYASQRLTTQLLDVLSRIIGEGIPNVTIANVSGKATSTRAASYAKQLIRSSVLLRVLVSELGFGSGEASLIIQRLANVRQSEIVRVDSDFAIPLQTLLSWKGPDQQGATGGVAAAGADHHTAPTDKVASSSARSIVSGDSSRANNGNVLDMAMVLRRLVAENDGLALDLQYRARENKKHEGLRADFKLVTQVLAPSIKGTTLDQLYDQYCEGLWVPNTAEARKVILSVCSGAAKDPEGTFNKMLVRADVSGKPGSVVDIAMPTFDKMPFEFENVAYERVTTLMRFREWGIRVGDEFRARVACLPETGGDSARRCYVAGGAALVLRPGTNELELLREDLAKARLGDAFAFLATAENRNPIAYFANRVLHRFFPLLPLYHSVAERYTAMKDAHQLTAQTNHAQLTRILAHEANQQVERDFRQNAQRYWKTVIENKGALEELGGGGAAGGKFGRNEGKNQLPYTPLPGRNTQGQQQQQQRGSSALGAVGGKPGGAGSGAAKRVGSATNLNIGSGGGRGSKPRT